MTFGIWNMRSLHRPVSVKTVAKKPTEHIILDLVVRSDGSSEALMRRKTFF